jgi:microcystin-dependent protein
MPVKFTNRATTLLASTITDSTTTIAITASSGSKFPSLTGSEWFPLVVAAADGGYEIMRATARSGDSITVTRAQEGTAARAFDAGARVELRLTNAALAERALASGLTNDSDVDGTTIADALETLLADKLDALNATYLASLPPPGTLRPTMRAAASTGWILWTAITIGDASSGGNYANANAADLFAVCWAMPETTTALFDSTGTPVSRGANAAADFAAHRRIALPPGPGRAVGVAGAGAGLTSRTLGDFVGAETVSITQANLPADIELDVDIPAGQGEHDHEATGGSAIKSGGFGYGSTGSALGSASAVDVTVANATLPAMEGTADLGGSGTALANMQPTSFMNWEIKL